MLVAAAVLPHPPLLVPDLAIGDEPALDDLRTSCQAAADVVRSAAHDRLYVVGADTPPHARSFGPWGAATAVDIPEPLPLSLLVGAWLTPGVVRSFVVVDPALDGDECAALGKDLADSAERVALLVMGDGAARHTEKAPGYIDPRAEPWDRTAHEAFARADTTALAELDQRLAAELLAIGRAPWQVLAGAAAGSVHGDVSASFSAPYGVGYHVVTWA